MRKPALLVSVAFHATAIALLLLAAVVAPRALPPPHRHVIELDHRLTAPPPVRPAEGGGSQRSNQLVREGRLPERVAARIFIPPMIERNDNPKLVIRPALLDAPDIAVNLTTIGSPFGVPGGGGGLGNDFNGLGNDGPGGIGDRGKPGFGTPKPLAPKLSRQPQVIHKEEPEYSDEARKAHMEGVVTVRIDVGIDGVPANIQVVRGVGLGLDEKAVEAIRKWRFRPALSGNQPVVAPALIEVGFRLL